MKTPAIPVRVCACAWLALLGALASARSGESARELVEAAGVRAGLVVHLGVTDGRLTAELGKSGGFLVHGLAADREALSAVRAHIAKEGLCGRVSVEARASGELPYAEGLVNLMLIGAAAGKVDGAEVARVLAPDGVVGFRGEAPGVRGLEPLGRAGGWSFLVRPRPPEMDEWSHGHYGPGGNRASRDLAAGPPERVRWRGGPDYPNATYGAGTMVSAGGRIFVFRTETPDRPTKLDWTFVSARDACSGVLLWKRPAAGYKRLTTVATRECLISTLGEGGKLAAFDALTGEKLRTYEAAGLPEAVVVSGDRMITCEGGKRKSANLRCLELSSGKPVWTSEATAGCVATYGPVQVPNIAVEGDRVFAADSIKRQLSCLELATGATVWSRDVGALVPTDRYVTLSISSFGDGVIVLGADRGAEGKGLFAFSAAKGDHLWSHKYPLIIWGRADRHRASSYRDVFFIDGLFWTHVGRPFTRETLGGADSWQGLAPRSGEAKKRLPYSDESRAVDPCYPATATCRYFMGGHTRYVETSTGRYVKGIKDTGLHGGCRFGVVVGNGLLYTSSMYMYGTFLFGDFAAAPGPVAPEDDSARLESGPAGGASIANPQFAVRNGSDWPCLRHDPARSGRTATEVPAGLRELWSVQVGSPAASFPGFGVRLSAPVISGGTVLVSSVDEHRVTALDAVGGKQLWSFTAGGRVRIPPHCSAGLCVFGSADGHVYCLRASDGELVWRFRAARARRRIVDDDRLESAWPADCGALAIGGTVYAAAGRHTGLDGGIDVWALDLTSGRPRWRSRVERRASGRWLLSSDGKSLAMGGWNTFGLEDGKPAATVSSLSPGACDDNRIDPKLVIGEPGPGKRSQVRMPMVAEAMIRAGGTLFVAGPDEAPPPAKRMPPELAKSAEVRWFEAREGRIFYRLPEDSREGKKHVLRAYALPGADGGGRKLSELELPARPTFGAMAAAGGRLYLCTADGKLRCYGGK